MNISRISAWSMWGAASLFYAYQYILRVMPNVMINDIMHQYSIDAVTFGQYSGVYYIGYALMHIPLGIMLDRYGPKWVLPVCIVMTAIGLLPILLTNNWIYPIIGRFLIGMGSSAAILSAFKIIRIAFSEKQFTRMLSYCVTVGLIGAIYGGAPVNYLNALFGYKTVVGIIAFIGFMLAALSYFIIPEIEVKQTGSVIDSLKQVFFSLKVLLVCLFTGFLVGPLEGFADVWGNSFLESVYAFSSNVSASLTSIIFFGMGVGGPLLSFVAEKTNSYIGTVFVSGVIMAISFFALVTGIVPDSLIGILFFIVGICCAYQIIAIYKASTYVKESAASLTSAVANMVIMSFGYFFHTVIGALVDYNGGVDSATALARGVSVIPVMLLIGSMGFFAIAMYDRITKSIYH